MQSSCPPVNTQPWLLLDLQQAEAEHDSEEKADEDGVFFVEDRAGQADVDDEAAAGPGPGSMRLLQQQQQAAGKGGRECQGGAAWPTGAVRALAQQAAMVCLYAALCHAPAHACACMYWH